MSKSLEHLFHNNRQWVSEVLAQDPDFFSHLATQQAPEYLWIGCSDSRVPANQITGLDPGEVFVHRNVANVVVHTDLNSLSVIQFAVDVLKVKHIIVVGHYGCSGVHAALLGQRIGIADNWLRHVRDVHDKHQSFIDAVSCEHERYDRLCEYNAIEQALNVCQTTMVQDAWNSGQEVNVHAWVYGVKDGLIRDLGFTVSNNQELNELYPKTIAAIHSE
ncbi:MAG: carbonic anhydrase [Ferrovum sp. 37-45-19]|uniref:carbonate dehydratase n=1 Tax=Ferrovum sp. JA12 TaxID=1356299 RepID=UPI0007034DED|nr:carbonate dehydratase [Ferrovum sp. JA12]OYV79001.1 MAG: carbonic anhydrase [Ferrovum sp. 21-44-67]OYV94366.1 MAG: carbonic anhydrase [Ferrovum sp. 37-45-19]OZB33255.1 MAG: carbonic anhydrase [Ferrovum sp. 34-44-207]HQT80625.1 carbonate dehydratase [Ferrovaceae bacterium]KRH79714.1 carbonic anhydrase 2 [Ferrovum sp. JA12]